MSDRFPALPWPRPGFGAGAGRRLYDGSVPPRAHDFAEIAVALRGQGRHRTRDNTAWLRRGDVVLLHPGTRHAADGCTSLELFHCCVRPAVFDRELAWAYGDPLLGPLLRRPAGAGGGARLLRLPEPGLRAATGHLDELAALQDRSAAEHRADLVGRLALLLGILARALPAGGTGPGALAPPADLPHPAVVQALHILDTQVTREWTLTALADVLGLTPGYLSRLFKGHTGTPPMAYLARRRTETAADLLAHTDATVAAVAERVGWSDQNYFARRFKAHFGVTPTAYRLRSRQKASTADPLPATSPNDRPGGSIS
ncbi:AraC family transcriptional regulator [Streptomyces sp. NPDC047000]|uniref:AraC family transcriptional regulator n=1 Tax=Streptomyces sp. NPDC047000 TaxID=3155474 RepID=UPI0033DFE516